MPHTASRLAASALLFLALLAPGLARAQAPAPDPVRVVVSVPPLAGLVRPLLPEGAELVTLIPPGSSPHGHKLRPSDLAALARADLVVANGLGVETGLERALARTASDRRTVLVAADLADLADLDDHHHDHAHGEDCDHGPLDVHLWFDFDIARKIQAAAAEALGTPPGVLEAAQAEIDATESAARAELEPYRGVKVVTQHDAYRRLFEPFGIEQVAVIRPIESAEPTAEDLRAAVEAVRTGGAVAVFVEPQMPRAAAERVAAAGNVPVGVLDPLGTGDWHALIRANARALADTLSSAR